MADLWFHCVVLLGHWNIPTEEIYRELARRWGRSGLEEKVRNDQLKVKT
jgi:phosphoribosyl-ATP pyrophosphohydrolase